MDADIRPFDADRDLEAIVAFSLRAWEPAYASMREFFGDEVFTRLYPDWRAHQEKDVRRSCAPGTTWVADAEGAARGFVVIGLPDGWEALGWVEMLAVDPEYQLRGLGKALTVYAIDRIRDAGRTVAMVETLGDPGHLPARRTYESVVGAELLPVARYFVPL